MERPACLLSWGLRPSAKVLGGPRAQRHKMDESCWCLGYHCGRHSRWLPRKSPLDFRCGPAAPQKVPTFQQFVVQSTIPIIPTVRSQVHHPNSLQPPWQFTVQSDTLHSCPPLQFIHIFLIICIPVKHASHLHSSSSLQVG